MDCCFRKSSGSASPLLRGRNSDIDFSSSSSDSMLSQPTAFEQLMDAGSFVWKNRLALFGTGLIAAGTAISSYRISVFNDLLTAKAGQPYYFNGTSPTAVSDGNVVASVIGPFAVGAALGLAGVMCLVLNRCCNSDSESTTIAADSNSAGDPRLSDDEDDDFMHRSVLEVRPDRPALATENDAV